MNERQKIKVLQISGTGRSGSTLLARLLGQASGAFSPGETRNIWRDAFMLNTLCECGAEFNRCDFWTAVVKEAYGGFENIQGRAVDSLLHEVAGPRGVPFLVSPLLTRGYVKLFQEHADLLRSLYEGIAKVSGCSLIVDSSKNPGYGFLLSRLPFVELHVLHLVRDSRAVAFSYQRMKVRPEFDRKTTYMETNSPYRSALVWLATNSVIASLRARSVSFQFVRYEDLISRPEATLRAIFSTVGLNGVALDYLSDGTAMLDKGHTAAGNPMRFDSGPVELRPDEEWRDSMAPLQKDIVTALTWPLLLRFGYWKRNGRH